MSASDLKKELHTLIDNTEDEQLLSMVKEELVSYQKEEKEFDFNDLKPEDRVELEDQDSEDPFKDTITEEEFHQHIEEWHIKLSTKKDL